MIACLAYLFLIYVQREKMAEAFLLNIMFQCFVKFIVLKIVRVEYRETRNC